jgi:uncharacterized protein YbjT (DUF2867 family)
MNVLVTGGTGHLGRAIVTRLDRDGIQAAITAQSTSAAARRGTTRWADWLARSATPLPARPWAGSGRAS